MNAHTQHTLTPWTVHPHHSLELAKAHNVWLGDDKSQTGAFEIYSDDGHGNGDMIPYTPADAAFIVTACNAHDALVAALRDLLSQAKNAIELGATGVGYWEDAKETIVAALAQVTP